MVNEAAVRRESASTVEELQRQLERLTLENNGLRSEMAMLRGDSSSTEAQPTAAPPEPSRNVRTLQRTFDDRPFLKPSKPQPFDPSAKDSNVRTWLFALNNFFTAARIPTNDDEARISFAVTLLQGPALEWWRHMSLLAVRGPARVDTVGEATRRELFMTPVGAETRARMAVLQQRPTTWAQFSEALLARFDLVNAGIVARNKIKRLRQLASVQDYTRRFLALCAEIDDLSEAEQRDRYFDGLKPEIQQILALQGIDDFASMVAAAERVDALQFQQRLRTRGRRTEDSDLRTVTAGGTRGQIICYNCQRPGHISRNCRAPRKQSARASGNEQRQ